MAKEKQKTNRLYPRVKKLQEAQHYLAMALSVHGREFNIVKAHELISAEIGRYHGYDTQPQAEKQTRLE